MPRRLFVSPNCELTDASADETKSTLAVLLYNALQIAGLLVWSAGVTAGKVVFEIAPTRDFAGAWFAIFTRDFVADGDAENSVVPFTWPGPFAGYGRWRVAEAIQGGTVSTHTNGAHFDTR
jgi:hypothetical protein